MSPADRRHSGLFQSAPPVKGATLLALGANPVPGVSIRAPREGGDTLGEGREQDFVVSIRAPREGGDKR